MESWLLCCSKPVDFVVTSSGGVGHRVDCRICCIFEFGEHCVGTINSVPESSGGVGHHVHCRFFSRIIRGGVGHFRLVDSRFRLSWGNSGTILIISVEIIGVW